MSDSDHSSDGTDHRQKSPKSGVDEISLSDGPYVWFVKGFGVEESDERAKRAEEAGEEVLIIYE